MRLLIASDEPISLGIKSDVRAWTQRILWFCEEGDSIILMDTPDPIFVAYVTKLIRLDPARLRYHVLPSRWVGGNFDAESLLIDEFQKSVAADAEAATTIVSLWPSSEVAWFATALGIEDKLPGARFCREGGGTLANSKVLFRALAGGADVPIPLGGVCRTSHEAFLLSTRLLREGLSFVVKKEYGGGGAGNEIVSTQPCPVSHAGHAAVELIELGPKDLKTYWERRWQWASCDDTNPIVIEAFVADARTLYVEVSCYADRVGVGMIGELEFEDGKISREIFPASDISDGVRTQLESFANRLGQAYSAIGYRGRLSLDSVVTEDGRVFFTEANARYTSSTHLIEPIAQRVVRVSEYPERVIVQFLSQKSWQIESLKALIETMDSNDLSYDNSVRKGLILVTPVIESSNQILLAAVAEDTAAAYKLIDHLDCAMLKVNCAKASS